MKIKIRLPDVEYDILQITSKEISILTTALLREINQVEKDSETHYYLKEIIDKITEAVSKVDKI